MKWKKLGRIFDPTEHKLPNNCKEFAQSPQALVFDDFVRIYFSTRENDQNGMYLSHIAYVEFDKKFSKIIKISDRAVINLGNLGCYDEHGIFPFNVLKDQDRILGYICGWSRRVSVPVETSIGLAVSRDKGLTFERIGNGPVLAASLNEPFLVGDPFVTKFNKNYHMWYIYGTRWIRSIKDKTPERVYKIGQALSKDGVIWHKLGKQLIENKLDINECQALPSVINFNSKYHMFFCYRQATDFRENKKRAYRIGHAFSKNLKNWTRDDENLKINPSKRGWDSDMLCYPHVFLCEDKIYMIYNGNEFGRFGFGLALLEE